MSKSIEQAPYIITVGLLIAIFFISPAASAKRPSSDVASYSVNMSKTLQNGERMRVLWTVSSYHKTKNATSGDSEARKLLFQPLDITPSSISFNGQTCVDISCSSKFLDTKDYFHKHFAISPLLIDYNNNQIEVIQTTCTIPGFSEYIRLHDRRLVVAIDGIIFIFSPNVNY